MVCFCIVDFFVTALDVPLTPGGDDGHLRSKALDGQLKTDLVVALTGGAVGDGVRALFLGNLHQLLADDGTCKCRAQQILLVACAHFHGGDDDVVHHLIHQIGNVELGCAGLQGLFFQALQLIILTHIAGHGDNLGVVVVLLQPGDDDGSIQPARIGEDDFFDFRLFHGVCLRV